MEETPRDEREPAPVRRLAVGGVLTAVLCASFATKSIPAAVIGLLLGPRDAALVVLGYLGLGAAGLPVLAGFRGGLGHFLGPDGGFILVTLVQAPLVSWLYGRDPGLGARQLGVPLLAGFLVHVLVGSAGTVLLGGTPPRGAALAVLVMLPWVAGKVAIAGGLYRALARHMPDVRGFRR